MEVFIDETQEAIVMKPGLAECIQSLLIQLIPRHNHRLGHLASRDVYSVGGPLRRRAVGRIWLFSREGRQNESCLNPRLNFSHEEEVRGMMHPDIQFIGLARGETAIRILPGFPAAVAARGEVLAKITILQSARPRRLIGITFEMLLPALRARQ